MLVTREPALAVNRTVSYMAMGGCCPECLEYEVHAAGRLGTGCAAMMAIPSVVWNITGSKVITDSQWLAVTAVPMLICCCLPCRSSQCR